MTPYETSVNYKTGKSPISATVVDFNNDTYLDIIVANQGDNNVVFLFGTGDGRFQTQTTFPTGNYPCCITSNDFNNDNKLDLAVVNQYDNNILVLLGT